MTQPRTYKDIPTLKQSPKTKAEDDYHRLGSYENPYARQSPMWMDYYMAFFDLVALEQSELNSEVQGN